MRAACTCEVFFDDARAPLDAVVGERGRGWYHLLATLDEEDRALLILKYAEGHDYDELAAIFPTTFNSAGTVTSGSCNIFQTLLRGIVARGARSAKPRAR